MRQEFHDHELTRYDSDEKKESDNPIGLKDIYAKLCEITILLERQNQASEKDLTYKVLQFEIDEVHNELVSLKPFNPSIVRDHNSHSRYDPCECVDCCTERKIFRLQRTLEELTYERRHIGE